MNPRRRDEKGLVGVILTIVIVWALIAVIMLTRTLEAAQTINTTVMDITGSVQGANSHLSTGCANTATAQCSDALPVLSQTETIASQINDAAKPLSGQAAQILTSVNSINSTASSILATATSINGTVHSINGLATSIHSSVQSIGSSLAAVDADVSAVQQQVVGINGRANTGFTTVIGIKGDTGNIASLASSILVQAQGICADHPVKVASVLPVLGPIC
jgi:hypothetical protein